MSAALVEEPPTAAPGSQPACETFWHDAEELRWAARQWAARIGVKLRQVHIRPMRSKWASISTAGRLTLDTHLLQAPKDLGEFVLVHELCHLLMPDHGRVFKMFLTAYMPDWEDRQGRLDKWGITTERRKAGRTAGDTPLR